MTDTSTSQSQDVTKTAHSQDAQKAGSDEVRVGKAFLLLFINILLITFEICKQGAVITGFRAPLGSDAKVPLRRGLWI